MMEESSSVLLSPLDFPTILGNINEDNICICLECSGRSHNLLQEAKHHIIEALLQLSKHENKLFNIIAFNSKICQWSDESVTCTPETVSIAATWLQKQLPQSTNSTLLTLLTALKDIRVQAVYILTFSQPDDDIDKVLDHLAYTNNGRPIHCRLVAKHFNMKSLTKEMEKTFHFLDQIARETFGSFAVVEPKHNGVESYQELKPTKLKTIQSVQGNVYVDDYNLSNCTVTPTLQATPQPCGIYPPPMPFSFYEPYTTWTRFGYSERFRKAWKDVNNVNNQILTDSHASQAFDLIIGKKVLCRKNENGLYYTGKVLKRTKEDYFMVEIGDFLDGEFIVDNYQETRLLNLMDYYEAWRHQIMPGDKVLARHTRAQKSASICYVPGTVLQGCEEREDNEANNHNFNLIVEFEHPINSTRNVKAGEALWIPKALFCRLQLEAAMPKKERNMLNEIANYPSVSLPGYPIQPQTSIDYQVVKPSFHKGREIQVDHLLPPYCLPVYPLYERLGRNDGTGDVEWLSDWGASTSKPVTEKQKIAKYEIPGNSHITVEQLKSKVENILSTTKISDSSVMDPSAPFSPSKITIVEQFHSENEITEKVQKDLKKLKKKNPNDSESSKLKSAANNNQRCPGYIEVLRPFSYVDPRGFRRTYDRFQIEKELDYLPRKIVISQTQASETPEEIGFKLGGERARDHEKRHEKALLFKREQVNQRLAHEDKRYVLGEIKQMELEAARRQRDEMQMHINNQRKAFDEWKLNKVQAHKRMVTDSIKQRQNKSIEDSVEIIDAHGMKARENAEKVRLFAMQKEEEQLRSVQRLKEKLNADLNVAHGHKSEKRQEAISKINYWKTEKPVKS